SEWRSGGRRSSSLEASTACSERPGRLSDPRAGGILAPSRGPDAEVMQVSDPVSVLVVAHQTAATDALLDAVRERARRGPASFHLVVPRQPHGMHKVVDPLEAGDEEARQVLDDAQPKLSAAAGRQVTGSVGDPEPLMAIE